MDQRDQRQLAEKRELGLLALAWLLLKHNGDDYKMAQEAGRFAILSRNVEQVCKGAVEAGSPLDAGWASELSAYQVVSRDWVACNETDSVLAQLKYRRISFDQNTIVETVPPQSAWTGPGVPIPLTRLTLASTARLPQKKLACMVGFTSESFDDWTPGVAANINEVMKRADVTALDRALIDPDLGPTDNGPGSLLHGLSPTPYTGASATQVEADFAALFAATHANDLKRALGVCAPATALFLARLRDANGFRVFPQMGATGGSIWNVPFVTTTACALVGSPGGNVIALIDASKVLVADDGILLLGASGTAAVQFDDAPSGGGADVVSAFQTHTKLLKLLRVVNFQRAAADAASFFVADY